jgi:predicted dithiol-disulfide oxidoreductase (DUF899 family)
MNQHLTVVTPEEWLKARLELLAREKEFTRLRDELSRQRRQKKSSLRDVAGASVFYKDPRGNIFHTYSCYERGLDMINAGYHLLDLVPKGRGENGLAFPQAWVRYRDSYED